MRDNRIMWALLAIMRVALGTAVIPPGFLQYDLICPFTSCHDTEHHKGLHQTLTRLWGWSCQNHKLNKLNFLRKIQSGFYNNRKWSKGKGGVSYLLFCCYDTCLPKSILREKEIVDLQFKAADPTCTYNQKAGSNECLSSACFLPWTQSRPQSMKQHDPQRDSRYSHPN